MKGLIIFLVGMPALGALELMLYNFFAGRHVLGFGSPSAWILGIFLLAAIPALAIGLLDGVLTRWLSLVPRVLATSAIGFLVFSIVGNRVDPAAWAFVLGLSAVIPAAVCSWLSGRTA